MSHTRVLIVHPETSVRALLGSMLQANGHRIEEAPSDRAAVRMMEQSPVELVVLGSDSGRDEWLDFLSYTRRKHPRIPVVLVLTEPHPEWVREALQWGAASVLRYPLPATHLRAAVAQALGETGEPQGVSAALPAGAGRSSSVLAPIAANGNGHGNGTSNGHGNGKSEGHAPPQAEGLCEAPGLIGDDPKLRQAIELAAMIAPTRAPVLIVGERGTGKSLLARSLHRASPRRNGPFVEIDCSALNEVALEAELFGRKGAAGDRPGRLAQAAGGTLFLDEIASLSPALQFKLLRLLQEGEFEPVGSNQTARADVRLVVASREDLSSLIEWGQFRQDLYYRLSVVTLKLPPLRHRGDDVVRLADHFRSRFARELSKPVVGFSVEAAEALRQYSWPGNVQELESAVERAVVVCRGTRVEPSHLELSQREPTNPRPAPAGGSHRAMAAAAAPILPLKEALEGPEKQLILQALEALNWNRQETARVLDINRTTLYKKMKKYGLLCDEPAWAN
jgi:DNA-binding NtrC family response regulator